MTPAEAINAAYALDRSDGIGSIEVGKRADIIILDVPGHQQLPYWFGVNQVASVVKSGLSQNRDG